MPHDSAPDEPASVPSAPKTKPLPGWLRSLLLWTLRIAGTILAGAASIAALVGVGLAVAYPSLPDISELTDYRPKLPMRVYATDGTLIGEFGEERRHLTPIGEIPKVMKDAVLAIEDSRFYSHNGVDYKGIVRAAVANLGKVKSQGASTITMQVARNAYLSSEKTFTRKLFEVLLTFKLEHLLTKDQILEIYMNQVFLGNRSYGFAAAADTYFGKTMKELTVAEAAMLAGLPKAPSTFNPITNPTRARVRQQYIIERMQEDGSITAEQATAAKKQELHVRGGGVNIQVHAEYVAETIRQLVFAQYGDDAYTRGLNVMTTVNAVQQEVAYKALRKGIMDYERRQKYRGPEAFVELSNDASSLPSDVDDALDDHPDNGDVMAAVVLDANAKKITALRPNNEPVEITGDGLKPAQSGLSDKAPPNIRIRRGAVIRVARTPQNTWEITQLPEVEGAFIAMDPRDGAIPAMVGGFDFNKNKFNHATQAWRQPGSSFKPFIYSSALEKGFTPSTVVNDAPLFFDAGVTGGQPWAPKNYGGKFDGPMALHTALAKSVNMVTIRVLMSVGARYAQEWITRFGFDAEKHPAYLTMGLGAGSVTPIQMAGAYSVFANGGYRVSPWLITKITDQKGKVLVESQPPLRSEATRAIDARNAFVMERLLNEVARAGTAARAQATLKRVDLYGKTGTTNDSIDTWFAGFQPTIAAIVWMGYDTPRSLGDRETGGGLSLPVWITFMETALKGVPVDVLTVPEGVVNVAGEWYFTEYAPGAAGIGHLTEAGATAEPGAPAVSADPTLTNPDAHKAPQVDPQERKDILDLFRR